MGDDAITAYHEQVNHPLFRKIKTSDFFDGNIGTFDAKHPYFLSKKSDVLQLPDRASLLPLQKKFGSASIWVIDIFLHVLAWLINLSDNQHIN